MSQFNSSVASALDAFNEQYAEARASTGAAKRPQNGTWDNILIDVKFESGTENSAYRVSQDVEVPGFKVEFKYACFSNNGASPLPEGFNDGEQWSGKPFIFPLGGVKSIPNLPVGKKKALEIQLERLKGHLLTINAKTQGNLMADIQAAQSLVGQHTLPAVILQVLCKVTVKEGKTDPTTGDKVPEKYFEEFLAARLA